MRVYFTASIAQRGQLIEEYKSIIKEIVNLGHKCITAYDILNEPLEMALSLDERVQSRYYQNWRKIISQVDAGVVEVSFPSTIHIGTEISALIERGKPVICLYASMRNPSFLNEFHSSRLIKLEYSRDSIKDVLKWGFEEVERMMNRRFTFFVSPEIDTYLEKVSKEKSLPRSEYIRNLILKDMKRR